jgi:outer membrane receptor protein involved in Fe transport
MKDSTGQMIRAQVMALLFGMIGLTQLAPASTFGILEGVVRDKENDQPIPGATILLVQSQQGRITDIDGRFVIYNVPAGKYTVRIQLIGYRTVVYENVEITANLRTRLKVDMEQSAVELSEIIVRAERPLIQKDIIGTTHTVTAFEFKTLPITSPQDILTFKPGTTLEGNVRGGKTSEVVYFIDGLPAQDVMQGTFGADIPTSSVVELSFQTGGFEAEYGNAQSGIVNIVTKSGTNEPHVMARLLKDDWVGGTEHNRETEAEIALSGPIIQNKLFYFFSGTYNQNGTRWWLDFEKFYSLPMANTASGFGKLDYLIDPSMKLSAQMLYSFKDWRDYEFSWRFNLDGLPLQRRQVFRLSANFTHTISEKTYYDVRVSVYQNHFRIGPDDRPAFDPGKIFEYDLFLQYITGGERMLWSNSIQRTYTIRSDITTQIIDHTTLKTGGEFNYYELDNTLEKFDPQKSYFGKPLVLEKPLNYSTAFRYFPKSGSGFVQGKYEVDNATVSLGLRYDFLNPTAKRPAYEFVPIRPNEFRLRLNRMVPSRIKHQISPRFGVSVPYREDGFVYVNYGYYFQYPLFTYLFSGLDVVTASRGASALLGNPNLEPERTKAWEISIKQVVKENVVLSATYFRKESSNLIDAKTFVASDSKFAGDYGFAEMVNNPFAEARGLELVLSRNKGSLLTGSVSYSFMEAMGISESATQGLNFRQWGFTPINTMFYLSWDQRHTLKINAIFQLPLGIQANMFLHSYTGRPYTYYPSRDGFNPTNPEQVFVPNNERMSGYTNLDVKFTKIFSLDFARSTDVTFFVDVRNALDKRNIKWMDSSGKVGGELEDPGGYHIGRRTRTGMMVEVGL